MANMGGEVIWHGETISATVSINNLNTEFTIGSDIATVNGNKTKLDSVIEAIDGRMMISLEDISDIFGYKVSYDKNVKEISISLK